MSEHLLAGEIHFNFKERILHSIEALQIPFSNCLLKISNKQDQVNNANSEIIFKINLLIIQGCQSGSVGRGGQLVRLVRLVW